MRREVPVERVLFALLLGVSLLLLSVAMLRSDMAAPSTSTRTFRDGFIVADRVERRTETASPADDAELLSDAPSSSAVAAPPAVRRREPDDALKSSAAPPAAAAAIRVSGADAHTTTIKMEDGDEITIKRAASSKNKNKITTISTHDDGKITIENHDHDALTPVPSATGGPVEAMAPSPAPVARLPLPVTTADPSAAKMRSVDFVDAYEREMEAQDTTMAIAAAGDDDAVTDEPSGGDNTHEIVVGPKKVAVVSVGRAQTKVSLSSVADTDDAASVTPAVDGE